MVNDYGDIPTIVISQVRHITKSANKCLCGHEWIYGVINREGKSNNITWRNLESVTCDICKKIYLDEK